MRGRAQPVFTKVLTPEGFRPIGELAVGDYVIGSNGEPTPVLGVYPQGEKDVYRVAAQDGAWTLCCGEHLWTVRTPRDKRRGKPWRVLETKEMIGKLRAAHARRYELPLLSAPVQLPEREVPMDPYALGLMLGDGCMTGKTTPSLRDGRHGAGGTRWRPRCRASRCAGRAAGLRAAASRLRRRTGVPRRTPSRARCALSI